MSKPNRERIGKWVAALRSKEFQQGKSALLNNGKYCCLGVACEVYRRETGQGVWDDNTGEDNISAFELKLTPVGEYDEDDMYIHAHNWETLPDFVAEWFGVGTDPTLTLENSIGGRAATGLNDDGFSFDFIADAIERTLL